MHDVDGVNAGYARLLLDEYLENPEAVLPEWRALFESGDAEIVTSLPGLARLLEKLPRNGHGRTATGETAAPDGQAAGAATRAAPAEPDLELLGGVAAAMALVKAHRMHGHLAATARPARLRAGRRSRARPAAPRSETHAGAPGAHPRLGAPHPRPRRDARRRAAAPAGDLLRDDGLRDRAHRRTTSSASGCGKAIESWRFRTPLAADEQRRLYTRLCQVEACERYLRRSFLGQKQFSLEGLDVLIPMLDESLELAAAAGTREVVLGMAHRGRLNVLAHTVGLPYEQILREFEGERTIEVVAADVEGGTGDVKYHLGARGVYRAAAGEIGVTLAANPSHLEAVDPVVEGWTRAEQTDRSRGLRPPRPRRVDADPAARRRRVRGPGGGRRDAQPLRARGLLDGRHAARDHEQPGRLHDRSGAGQVDAPLLGPRQGLRRADRPRERRRPRGGDLGRAARARLPRALRPRRRDRPRRLPPLRPQRAGRGRLHAAAHGRADRAPPDGARAVRDEARRGGRARRPRRPRRSRPRLSSGCARRTSGSRRRSARTCRPRRATRSCRGRRPERVDTRVPAERLRRLNEQLLRVPDGFTVHPKLVRQLERRRDGARRGRDRLGPGRVARVRLAARGRRPDPADRPGHRARDVLAPPPRAPRRRDRRALHADPGARRRRGVVRGLQLAALRVRVRRVRVRLLDGGAGGARALGGAVRRLRERRADDHRPVHLERARQVAADVTADAAPPARLRGQRPGALERAARAVPPARRAGEHPDRELHDRGAVLPPAAAAGARPERAAARRDDAEGAASAEGGVVDARTSSTDGALPASCSTPPSPTRSPSGASCSARGRSTTTSSATKPRTTTKGSRSRGSSSSTRSRSRPPTS